MAGGGEVHSLLLAVHIDIMGLVVLIAAVGLEGASSGVEVNVVAVAGLALIDEDDLSNAVIKNGAAYITANGTTYIVDKDTKFVDVDENQVYTGFENVPDYIADSTVDGGKVSFWAIDTRSTSSPF